MPNSTFRTWTEHDIAKLTSLAGKAPAAYIADQLGRTQAAVVMQASKMKLSLRTRAHAVLLPMSQLPPAHPKS